MQEVVAIYRRVSTSYQVESGVSLQAQKETLTKLCDLNNYKIYKDYCDEGISGKDTEHRPAFREMMEDMKKGLFSKIIVLKIDRMSRNIIDLEKTINEMQKYNCEFESASEKIDTNSSMGRMFIRLLGIFAQFERERISERIQEAVLYKLENGEAISNPIIGYNLFKNDEGKTIWVIDEEKKDMVNAVFDTYEKTNSLKSTTIFINEKYPDKVYKNGFSTTDIKEIMQHTQYYGYYALYDDSGKILAENKNYCEPYLTYDRWKKINDMRENKNIKKTKNDNVYLFPRKIKGICGHNYTGRATINNTRKNPKPVFVYGCEKNIHQGTCNYNMVTEKRIEEEVLKKIPKELNKYLEKKKKQALTKKQVSNIDTKIKKLENEKKRYTTSFINGWLEESEAKRKINNIDFEIKELEKTKETNTKTIEELIKIVQKSNFESIYQTMSKEQKQIFFNSFIDYIVVDKEKYANKQEFTEIHFL